jgi:hypothetical protein
MLMRKILGGLLPWACENGPAPVFSWVKCNCFAVSCVGEGVARPSMAPAVSVQKLRLFMNNL